MVDGAALSSRHSSTRAPPCAQLCTPVLESTASHWMRAAFSQLALAHLSLQRHPDGGHTLSPTLFTIHKSPSSCHFSPLYTLCVQIIRAETKLWCSLQVQPWDAGLSMKAFVKPLPCIHNFPTDFWLVDPQLLSDLRLCSKLQKARLSKWLQAKQQNKTRGQEMVSPPCSPLSFKSMIVTGKTFCITICSCCQTGPWLASYCRPKLAEIKRKRHFPRLLQVANFESLTDATINLSHSETQNKDEERADVKYTVSSKPINSASLRKMSHFHCYNLVYARTTSSKKFISVKKKKQRQKKWRGKENFWFPLTSIPLCTERAQRKTWHERSQPRPEPSLCLRSRISHGKQRQHGLFKHIRTRKRAAGQAAITLQLPHRPHFQLKQSDTCCLSIPLARSGSVVNDSCQWPYCTVHTGGAKMDMAKFTFFACTPSAAPAVED